MSDSDIQRFREIIWRRPLTSAEQTELNAWLNAHPEFRAKWESEMPLASALSQLPNPGVSSNFTSRVMQAVEREALAGTRPRILGLWQRFAPRVRWATGTCVAAMVAGAFLFGHHAQKQHDLALLKSVTLVSGVSAIPNTEVLTNFEAIRALNQAPQPDDQLLALLQ